MMTIRRLATLDDRALDALLDRGRTGDPDVARTVTELLASIRRDGDAALRDQTARLDGVDFDDPAVAPGPEVPRSAWTAALESLDDALRDALDASAASIRRFHAAQAPQPVQVELEPGLVLGRRPDPLRRVGVYAPGGRAAYPSSVLMGVVPARVAGVDEVVVCSPPGTDGRPSPLVMAACAVAGADRLFALGGTAAIGALAYGTTSVPRVDRIVGPGNAYVMAAKLQVAAVTGIDAPAGPSELLVLADASADPETVAIELMAQAEHDPDAAVVLVSTDERVARETARALTRLVPETPRRTIVEASLAANGALLLADNLPGATAFAERYAPEHLLILTERPRDTLTDVRCAGTVFLGPRSSVAFGDYATGANHVLPTGGLARSYSGLSVDDFVRWTTWQEVGSTAAPALAAVATALAEAERLPAHAAAARHAAAGDVGDVGDVGDMGDMDAGANPGASAGAIWSPGAVLPRRPYRRMSAYDPARPPLELDLSANTNLFGTCPPALEVLATGPSPAAYPGVYADGLKAAIADAWSIDASQVVTGCGSDDVIDSAIRAFCDPGAVVAFPAPTFPMTDLFARMNDARPRPVPLSPTGDLDDDAVASLAAAELVYLCRPNNPTGAMVSRERVAEVLARARGVVLIDEAYGEFAGESLLELVLDSGRGVVLRTFSKAYGMAGLRVGYAMGPAPLVRAIELSRGPYKVSGLAERAGAAAMRDGQDWIREIVARTVASRDRLAESLRRRGLPVAPSAANFVLAGVPARSAARVKAGLAERGIGVRAFEGPLPGPAGDAIRITAGPWPMMERLLEALDEVLASHGAQSPENVGAQSAEDVGAQSAENVGAQSAENVGAQSAENVGAQSAENVGGPSPENVGDPTRDLEATP